MDYRHVSLRRRSRGLMAAVALTASPCAAAAQESFAIEPASQTRELRLLTQPRISHFSGLPVPRFASLKYDEVNGRGGPSTDYPVKWRYERQGLPVLVIKESRDWRKIRDPQGDEVWVHERMLGARRTAITAGPTTMFEAPGAAERPLAEIAVGVVAELSDCANDWCSVLIDGRKGWIMRASLWGADALASDQTEPDPAAEW